NRQAAPEGAEDRAHTAEHYAGIHHNDKVEADVGLERLRHREQAACDRSDANTEAEGYTVRAVDVDSDIGGGDPIVRGRAQRPAEICAHEEEIQSHCADDR